jgi:hypothetical protein
MSKVKLIILAIAASAAPNTENKLLDYIKRFSVAPRQVSRKEYRTLISGVCDNADLRTESIREEIPLLFPLEYLPIAVAARCGELVLYDGRTVKGKLPREGMFADTPGPGFTKEQYPIVVKTLLPFRLLAGPDNGPRY